MTNNSHMSYFFYKWLYHSMFTTEEQFQNKMLPHAFILYFVTIIPHRWNLIMNLACKSSMMHFCNKNMANVKEEAVINFDTQGWNDDVIKVLWPLISPKYIN